MYSSDDRLGPDQAQQRIKSDLVLNCITLWWYLCKGILKKADVLL